MGPNSHAGQHEMGQEGMTDWVHHLWQEEQVCHGSTMSPNEDGGVLEHSDLLIEVQPLDVHHLHHTARPLGQHTGLQLPYVQNVPPCLVGSIHNGHCQWALACLHKHVVVS